MRPTRPTPSRCSSAPSGGDGGPGVARACLSQHYRIIDNFDYLVAALEGVRAAGVETQVKGCDLTERNMHVRIWSPQVAQLAPVLLANYRSPFGGGIERIREVARREGQGFEPGGEPVVFAGFTLRNSEVGCGAWSITPQLVVQICGNGLTVSADAIRGVHLGGKMDEGVVEWSDETLVRELAVVTSKAADAVRTFLSPDYLARQLASIEEKAARPLAVDPAKAVEVVTKRLKINERHAADVLSHFVAGGQLTCGGVMQAVSSVAQTISDADLAAEFEALALRALDEAVAVR